MNYLSILKLWAFVLIPVFFGTIYFFKEEEEKPEVITFLGENNLDQLMGITLCREMAYVPEDFLTKPIGVSNVRIGSIDFPISTASREAQEMFNQGMAYYYNFDYVQAARSFHDGVRLDPEAAMICNALSIAYTNLADTVKSKEFGTKAFELARKSGNRFEYLYTKSNFLALEPPSGMEGYQALYDSVYAVKDALISEFPDNVESWVLAAEIRLYFRDLEESEEEGNIANLEMLEKALATDPDHFGVWHLLIHSNESLSRFEDALKYGKMYTEAAPDIPHAWHMYGHDLMKTGNIDEAIIKFSMALDLEKKKYDREDMPYHYDWHYPHNLELLAYCYQYKGQFENAKAIFVQLDTIQAFQEESEGKIRKGHPFFLLQNGEYDEAIYLADKLAKGEGINTKLVANISSGLAHMMKRDEKNAMKSTGEIQILLDSLVNEVSKYGIPEEMFTSSSYFQFYKGLQDLIENGLVLQKDPENIKIKEKIETFQKQMLSQTGPDPWIESLYFLQLLSNITYSTGNMELAESSAKALLEHDPEFGGGLYAMARVQKRKNNETAASESMAKAKLAYKDGDEELLKRLGF